MTIKNGDLPAMPVCYDARMMAAYSKGEAMGLSKREMFAMAAMQGILANQCMVDDCSASSLEWTAKRSASMADALLAELERTKGEVK